MADGPGPPPPPPAPPTIFPGSFHAVMQYDQEIPQSYNADQPTVTLKRATDQSLDIGKTTK